MSFKPRFPRGFFTPKLLAPRDFRVALNYWLRWIFPACDHFHGLWAFPAAPRLSTQSFSTSIPSVS
ncbi:hypothetical protein EBZ70_04865 [bacterium]|nr:hypothetical protein [bacterium]